MSAGANASGATTSLLGKSVLVFGSGGALGSAVAHRFAAANWRVIGCSSGWAGLPSEGVLELTAVGGETPASASMTSAKTIQGGERPSRKQEVLQVKRIASSRRRVVVPEGGRAIAATESDARGNGWATSHEPKSETWLRRAGHWNVPADPPHAIVEVVGHSFDRAFSLQRQGEDLLERLQPLLAAGPPLHATICCCGAFDMTPPGSSFFLDEAQRLIKANCWPALLCAHTATVLQQSQRTPLLLVLTGAAAVAQTNCTPSMIAYGCAKSYVHHLVRSLAAASAATSAGSRQADESSAMKHHGEVERGKVHDCENSSHDKRSSHGREEAQVKRDDTEAEMLPALRVVGLLPTILDTPANRESMKDVSESIRASTWTDVRDVAQQLLRWAEHPEMVANGQFYVVSTKGGKTEFKVL